MIIDMIQGFKYLYNREGDNLILNNYPLKQGVYILVGDKGIKEHIFISDKQIPSDDKYEILNYFKIRDYLSILKLYDTNKCVSGKAKSIHSNNYLSLFIRENKSSPILKNSSLNASLNQQIELYFKQFMKWKEEEIIAKKNNDSNNPREFILTKLEEFNDILFNKSKAAILNSLSSLPNILINYNISDKDYIRIFYDTSIDDYNSEYKRYMIRKIFNKDIYHIFKNNDVYGVSDIDFNTNSNKPSLLLKNMKTKVPFRLDFDTMLIAQKLFDFLYFYKVPKYNKELQTIEYVNSIYKTLYIPTDFDINNLDLNKYNETDQSVYYVSTGNGQSFNIIHYDIIYPFNIGVPFEFKDYLFIEDVEDAADVAKNIPKKIEISSLNELEKIVDQYFFNFNLVNNYHNDKFVSNKSYSLPNNLSCVLFSSKGLFYNWFRKGIDLDIIKPLTKILNELIEMWTNVPNISTEKIINMLNLKWSILDYLYKREEYKPMEFKKHFSTIRNNLKIKINDKSPIEKYINSTEEFYYACGQLTYYLLTQNKKTLKKQQNISKFLQCRTSSLLKMQISKLCEEVTDNISTYNYKFNNLYSMVSTYIDNSNVRDYIDYLQAGLYQSNIIYEKRKREKLKYDDEITII